MWRLFLVWGTLGLGLVLAQTQINFGEMYSGSKPSGKLLGTHGKQVEMVGYMAPPLKPKLDFFVLTRAPMSSCPFCSSAAEWPSDIVVVIMPEGQTTAATLNRIRVVGRLEVGLREDQETGFVSLVRIYADYLEPLRGF